MSLNASVAVYAGSFDPVTCGHVDLIQRSSRLFGQLIVGVGNNPRKSYLFDSEERVTLVKGEVQGLSNVQVKSFDGLLIEFTREMGAQVILRGLRAVTDFEFEFQLGLANMDLAPRIETMFMLAGPHNIFINSSTVKEIAACGGPVSRYVSAPVASRLYEKLGVKPWSAAERI